MSHDTESTHAGQGGTDWELRQAERQIEALANSPALAQAFRRHAEGVRNMIQGELGQSFIRALEATLTIKLAPIATGQEEIRLSLATLVTDLHTLRATSAEHTQQIEALAQRVARLEARK